MKKIGIQWQRETNAVLEYNRLIRPTVLKSVNARTREFWQKLKDSNPYSMRIYRHYPNFEGWEADPEGCAARAVQIIKAEIGHIADLITHVEDNNEWIHSFMHDQVDAADRYMSTFIEKAWQELGLHTVFLNSACGHWGDDVIKFWRTLQTAEWRGAILGQHEYDWPTMDRIYKESGDYWLCGKWKKSMAAIKAAGHKGIKCVGTEAGIDGGVAGLPMKGWKNVPNALENYCASLLWYNDLLINDDDVLGAALFIMSGEGMWSDFDIENSQIPARIVQFPEVPESPEPPNGGTTMAIRVFDMNNVQRDEAWAEAKYGVAWRRADVSAGKKIWRLVELREKTGNHSLVTKTVDAYGQPKANVAVTFYWSGAPIGGDPPTEIGPYDWYNKFVWGLTNVNGDVGPGMGTGAYHGIGQGGPHAVWIHDLQIPSDVCEKLGMLAGTFHDHLDQVFQLVVAGEVPVPPVPPTPPTDSELLKEIQAFRGEVKEKLDKIIEKMGAVVPTPPPASELFHGVFYNNITLAGPPVWSHDVEKIDFSWADGSPNAAVSKDNFSACWTGKKTFAAGTYTFHTYTDDGVKLWVDGALLINKWVDQAPTEWKATVALSAGKHDIKMEYYEKGGGATCKLWWD